jgi:hypothetical protein
MRFLSAARVKRPSHLILFDLIVSLIYFLSPSQQNARTATYTVVGMWSFLTPTCFGTTVPSSGSSYTGALKLPADIHTI